MKSFSIIVTVLLLTAVLSASGNKSFSSATIAAPANHPVMITGISIPVKTDEKTLTDFVKNGFYKNFAIGKDVEPKLFKAVQIDGTKIYKFVPFYKGIPIEGVYTVLTIRNGKIDRINNSLGKIDIDVTKMISEKEAVKSAMDVRNIKKMPKKYSAEKIITRHLGRFTAAYKVRFAPISLADSRFHIVDAITGKVIKSGNSTYFADADTEVADDDVIAEATDMAKIWEFNPLVNETLIDVELPWVAPVNDAGFTSEEQGFLTTDIDANGIRKIKAFNCPDKDEKVSLEEMTGYAISVPMCSPTQLANKVTNGSFIYDDCEEGHEFVEANMTEEKIDRCAEISMYYHASKIYKYIRGLYKDVAAEGEFYLQNNDETRPLNVIGNFTTPELTMEAIMGGSMKLVPMDNAMFSQDNPTMGDLLAQFGVKGDLLIFGQGTKGDFGYDGDVIYHEFGHATVYTAGIVGMEFADKYGMSNEPGSVHEGTADTFAFLMTDNSCTGEYASEAIIKWAASQGGTVEMDKEGDFYCMRTALNEYRVFEDFIAEVHWDGQPLLGANWEIYQLIKGNDTDTQVHRDNLMKLILKTLYAVGDGDASFKLWADTFMDEVGKDDNFKAKKADIEKILTDRNFFEEKRARSANTKVKTSYVAAAAAAEGEEDPTGGLAGGGSGLTITVDGEEINVAPSYLQFYYDVPADSAKNGLKVTATVAANSGGSLIGGTTGTPILDVYYRKGSPVEYVLDEESLKITVLKDGDAVAEGTGTAKTWGLFGIEKGERYYFQFINTASSAGMISNISVVTADVEEEVSDEDDSDAEVTDEASFENDVVNDEEQKETSKSSSGCSLIAL